MIKELSDYMRANKKGGLIVRGYDLPKRVQFT